MIATNLATSEEVAVTRVTSQGTFRLEVPVQRIALTVTNSSEFAYLPSIEVNDGQGTFEVKLSSECSALRGYLDVEGTLAQRPDFIRFERFSESTGDVFGVSVDEKLRFEACLPHSDYRIALPPQFAERFTIASIPVQDSLRITATARRHASTPSHEPLGIAATTRDLLVARLPSDVQLLGLGESNHGSGEFTLERARLMIALARQLGFSTILFEAGLGETLGLDAYIHGATLEVEAAIRGVGYWTLSTEEMRSALEELRAYNMGVDAKHQIRIVGIDIQTTGGALDDLASAGMTSGERALLERLRDKSGVDWMNFSPAERATARSNCYVARPMAVKRAVRCRPVGSRWVV